MTTCDFFLVSGLEKVLPYQKPTPWQQPGFTLLSGERRAFQLACRGVEDRVCGGDTAFTVSVKSDLGPALCCRQVGLVPCDYPCHGLADEDYLTTRPELLPDVLRPVDLSGPLKLVLGQWRSLWFTVDTEGLAPGSYSVQLTVTGPAGNEPVQFTVPVTVLSVRLPAQTLYHTEWFHADCLADYYHVPVFSEQHWALIDSFMAAAARCGVNMLLTPVFTPPLDTAPGGERTTVQLVDVEDVDGEYRFGFEKLHRWAGLCRKNGITELEIAHLFTQWGAEAAPKVMVKKNGILTRRFGWDTPAVGGEYTRFLHAFLPALKAELSKMGLLEHSWFHISDEPADSAKNTYLAAKNEVKELLAGCKVIDALSSFDLYKEGIVPKPVVCVDHIQPFLDARTPGLWAYYCTCQAVKVPNRFIAMPSTRNRILGVLLYVEDIEGFLHWGFNFYNSQFSLRHIDPFRVTDSGDVFPSGDPFLVYPAPDGTAWDSIRSEVLGEAMQDLRLLQLCEEKLGRPGTLALVQKAAGMEMRFDEYPRDAAFFDRLRETLLSVL